MNTHRIRKSQFQTIHGRPNVLYEIPSISGGLEGLKFIEWKFDQAAASVTKEEYPDYQKYFDYLREVLERREPENDKRHHRCSSNENAW